MSTSRRGFLKSAVAVGGVALGDRAGAWPARSSEGPNGFARPCGMSRLPCELSLSWREARQVGTALKEEEREAPTVHCGQRAEHISTIQSRVH